MEITRLGQEIDADIYVLCHATSPFIRSETIEKGLRAVRDGEYDSAFAAQRLQTFVWYKGERLNYDPDDVPRTQDIEPICIETSAFFIYKKHVVTDIRRRIGNRPLICECDNVESVDIDYASDYEMAVKLMGDA